MSKEESKLIEESNLITVFRSLKIFTEEQLQAIAEASNNHQNFPIEHWYDLEVKARALYFDCIKYFNDYMEWEKSGRTKVEPVLTNKELDVLPMTATSESNHKPTVRVAPFLSTPSKIPSLVKAPQTPQPVRKKPILSKSNSSSSLFKQKPIKSSYSPIYRGKDILLEKADPILNELDSATRGKLTRKPAISFPNYDRIDSSSAEALKILKAKLDERGKTYRELGSESNSSVLNANSSIVTKR